MSEYKIRAHHGMCLAFFKGKGYSSEFTKHMGEMKSLLTENPRVRIIAQTDDICSACPNNEKGSCTSAGKVEDYDRQVLLRCDLEEGTELNWLDFEELVNTKILAAGKRKEICGNCQWDSVCVMSPAKAGVRVMK